MIAALGDFSFDLFGYSMALTSVFFQTMYLVLVEKSGAEDGLSSVEIMFYNSFLSLPFLLFLIIATGEFPNSLSLLLAKLAMVELQGQPSSEGSRPLSEPEIMQEILGLQSGYVRGLGWGPRPSRSDGAESSRTGEERAEQERAIANVRLNALETQNQQLQRQLTMVLSILRTSPGISITDSMVEDFELPSD